MVRNPLPAICKAGILVPFCATLFACAGTGEPPEIVELRSTSSSVSQDEIVVVFATVTDPDGLDNVAGGKLVSDDGTVFYSPFEQLSNGTFASAISWAQLHRVRAIEFPDRELRTIVAQFMDNDRNDVSQPFTLELTCHGLVACDGSCVDTAADASHCGACGHACPSTDRCDQGTCVSNCEPCLQANCPLELSACAAEPICTALRGCIEGCSDQACVDTCSTTHAGGMAIYHDLYECYQAGCAGYCGTAP